MQINTSKTEDKGPVDHYALLNQCKEYLLTTWSKSCVNFDDGDLSMWIFSATNGHHKIYLRAYPAGNTFLEISEDNDDIITFNGYIRSLEDFKTILELTSIRST